MSSEKTSTSFKAPRNKVHQNLKMAEDLFNFAYKVKLFQIKKQHPDWSQEALHEKTMELIELGCR